MKEHITHQDIKPFIPKDAKFLILGSLPSVKSREQGFYYAHPQNRFFKVLSSIFNTQEPASIEDRKAFLNKYKIGLYDVVFECDIDNSDDSTISNVKVINLKKILKDNPSIKVVAINGGKAKSLFQKYLLKDVNEDIKVVYCPSTSPRNARTNIDNLVEKYKIMFLTSL